MSNLLSLMEEPGGVLSHTFDCMTRADEVINAAFPRKSKQNSAAFLAACPPVALHAEIVAALLDTSLKAPLTSEALRIVEHLWVRVLLGSSVELQRQARDPLPPHLREQLDGIRHKLRTEKRGRE